MHILKMNLKHSRMNMMFIKKLSKRFWIHVGHYYSSGAVDATPVGGPCAPGKVGWMVAAPMMMIVPSHAQSS